MTPGGLFCVGVLDRSAWERGHPCALEEGIMAAPARGVQKLRDPAGRARQGAISLALAVVPIDRLPELADVPGIEWMQVVRVPALELNISAPAIGADQAAAIYRTRGDGVLVGDVDSGVDWHHADFRNQDGTTRIRYLWDQTTSCSAGVGSVPPPPFDFGCQYTESEINAALAGGPSFTFTDVDGHGTHVLGIAGGNGRGTGNGQPSGVYVGVASRANLIMIKIFPDVQGACSRCFDVGLGLDM